MNSQEYIIWLKGFTEGVHEFNITPKQWDILKDKLAEVDQPIRTSGYVAPLIFTSGSYGTGTANIGTITTTPGVSSITIANPSFGSTSTATAYPSGSSITYTANGGPTWYSVNKIENDSREK